ncbi:LysR family transcriptional regulator [Denitrobaculum tricleocarpae]|uniref:LysR family transcriptional regulator n=1 Tax=Denitrobaculum tricleocarpae TaxID=2591009 RepID=A0A545U2Y3_9PROT|nr:LysR family transcriptional regulator [Denitrobaculum tricleocarpae]TQV83829.1 LysR family transcriptional regulator [Denitrobaculum tricleocarpae]
MINANWLESFITLTEEESFTKTAKRLNMTQPGVSQQIRKLEEQIGAPLLQRIGKGFLLTDAGEDLRVFGLRRREEEARLLETLGRDDPHSGTVGIAASGSFANLLYPALLPYLAQHPDLCLTLQAAPERSVIEAVAEGTLDLGVVNSDPEQKRLLAQKIGEEELCLITPSAAGPGTPGWMDLERLGFIDHPDGQAYAEQLMPGNYPAFEGAGSLRRRGFVNQINQIPASVAAGVGYTILPRSGILTFPRAEDLSIVDLTVPHRQALWLITRAGRKLPARCRWAEEEIRRLGAGLCLWVSSPETESVD